MAPHQCNICYNKFSFNPSSKDKSLLPVQSRVCSHIVCHNCVLTMYETRPPACLFWDDDDLSGSESNASCVPCPECRLPGAFSPFEPIVCLPLCELLAERHRTMLKYQIPPDSPSSPPPLTTSPIPSFFIHLPFQLPSSDHLAKASAHLAETAQQTVDRVCEVVHAKVEKELQNPYLGRLLLKQASSLFYWSTVLVFGPVKCGGRRNEAGTSAATSGISLERFDGLKSYGGHILQSTSSWALNWRNQIRSSLDVRLLDNYFEFFTYVPNIMNLPFLPKRNNRNNHNNSLSMRYRPRRGRKPF